MKGYGSLRSKACKWGLKTNSKIQYNYYSQLQKNNLTYILTHSRTALYGRLHILHEDDIDHSSILNFAIY